MKLARSNPTDKFGRLLAIIILTFIVSIVERPEPVFVVEPRTPQEWALFAYHIGNRHQPLMVTERALVCPDVPGVEQVLQQHRMPYATDAGSEHPGRSHSLPMCPRP